MKKRNLIIMMISLSIVLLFGTSYALLKSGNDGQGYVMDLGQLQVEFEDGKTEALSLENAKPSNDTDGMKEAKTLTFVVRNNGNIDATYSVYIEELSTEPEFKSVIRFASNKNDMGYNTPKTLGSDKYIDSGATIKAKGSNVYKVKVWLSEEADSAYMNKTFSAKIVVDVTQNKYQDKELNGADPIIKEPLVPVTIANDGTVTKTNIYSKWYDYANKEWANAVILVDTPSKTYKDGETILEKDIESYFVWIPRYKYKIWNLASDGGYLKPGDLTNTATWEDKSFGNAFGNARIIDIVFESNEVKPVREEKLDSYYTHPAFTLGDTELNGIWVGKFETGYNQGTPGTSIDSSSWTTGNAQKDTVESAKIVVKPNVFSWRNQKVSNMFKTAIGYHEELSSHMMKNTEWGAAAYLSHSIYGKGAELNINNNNQYKTGYSAAANTDQSSYQGTYGNIDALTKAYNTTTGYLASTTGNITGIYDMSGGTHEYMASYRPNSTGDASGFTPEELAKVEYQPYLEKYSESSTITSYNLRILGDATGEMGPFYQFYDKDGNNRYHNSWYADHSDFVDSSYPWFHRGGSHNYGVLAGQFGFSRSTGGAYTDIGSRLVLAVN